LLGIACSLSAIAGTALLFLVKWDRTDSLGIKAYFISELDYRGFGYTGFPVTIFLAWFLNMETLAVALVPIAVLLVLGWFVKWVYRGYKQHGM
jgi:phosphoglycerol transferase MdoB-like AlkP superfamily enzyme